MSEVQNELDLESLSLEELRQRALDEAGKPTESEESAEPTRDEKGRFAKAEETPEAPAKKTVFVREIDFGDGSGKQVFQGETVEALLDQLMAAQISATKKIREQAEELKTIKAKKQQDEQAASDDEEYIYSQELMSRPTDAMKKMFKKVTGLDITDFKTKLERIEAFETAATKQQAMDRKQEAASAEFIKAHPEYILSPRNGKLLVNETNKFIEEAKADSSDEEIDYQTLLEKAYQHLTESGLLELKVDEDVTAEEEQPEPAPSRIARTEEVVPAQRPKKASSLSNRGRSITPAKTELSEEDLYNMPLDKLRELGMKQMR